jgi:hypothetical protein
MRTRLASLSRPNDCRPRHPKHQPERMAPRHALVHSRVCQAARRLRACRRTRDRRQWPEDTRWLSSGRVAASSARRCFRRALGGMPLSRRRRTYGSPLALAPSSTDSPAATAAAEPQHVRTTPRSRSSAPPPAPQRQRSAGLAMKRKTEDRQRVGLLQASALGPVHAAATSTWHTDSPVCGFRQEQPSCSHTTQGSGSEGECSA